MRHILFLALALHAPALAGGPEADDESSDSTPSSEESSTTVDMGAGAQIGSGGLGSTKAANDSPAPREKVVASVQPDAEPSVEGRLEKRLIATVIKRHMNQIRYCYQRELVKDPDLGGRLVVTFVIATDGSVASASVRESTLNNAATEQCIIARFDRMQFPEPEGGGVVKVHYPFEFDKG